MTGASEPMIGGGDIPPEEYQAIAINGAVSVTDSVFLASCKISPRPERSIAVPGPDPLLIDTPFLGCIHLQNLADFRTS
ncbi:hypothetical protein GVN24_13200 [Rhizobium sp. CRIBSB]|nr:hypothetical protein [Rhizobium sp. CRIBSB]